MQRSLARADLLLTINCHLCYICYLAFVYFIVFGCHYSHALTKNIRGVDMLIGSVTPFLTTITITLWSVNWTNNFDYTNLCNLRNFPYATNQLSFDEIKTHFILWFFFFFGKNTEGARFWDDDCSWLRFVLSKNKRFWVEEICWREDDGCEILRWRSLLVSSSRISCVRDFELTIRASDVLSFARFGVILEFLFPFGTKMEGTRPYGYFFDGGRERSCYN